MIKKELLEKIAYIISKKCKTAAGASENSFNPLPYLSSAASRVTSGLQQAAQRARGLLTSGWQIGRNFANWLTGSGNVVSENEGKEIPVKDIDDLMRKLKPEWANKEQATSTKTKANNDQWWEEFDRKYPGNLLYIPEKHKDIKPEPIPPATPETSGKPKPLGLAKLAPEVYRRYFEEKNESDKNKKE